MANPIDAGAGILTSIASGILGNQQDKWQKNTLIDVLNQLRGSNQWGLEYGQQQFNPASATAQQLLQIIPGLLFGDNGDVNVLQRALQGAIGGINPGQFQQSAITPEMQQVLSQLGNTAGSNNGTQDLLRSVIGNGGGSQQGQDIWDSLRSLSLGRGANNNAQSDAAFKLLTNPQSSFTNNVRDAAGSALDGSTPGLQSALAAIQQIVNAGGSNKNMDAGLQAALGLLSGRSGNLDALSQAGASGLSSNLGVSGLTPTGAKGEQTALEGLQRHGANPTTDFFTSRGAQLAGQDAVLPTLLATSIARDEATKQYKNAAEEARSKALSLGGGPGSVVANGTSNDALADFADRGAEGISSAVGDTLLKQQALNLQQQGQGAQMGLGGGQIQASNLGQYGDLLASLENNATNRFGTSGNMLSQAQQGGLAQTGLGLQGIQGLSGLQSQNILSALGLVPGMENAGTNRAGTMGGLGLNAEQIDLARLAQGGNLNNSFNNTLLHALQGMQGNVNQANNYTLGASGALNNMTGTEGGLLDSIFRNQLGGSQQGTNQSNSFYNALNQLFGQQNTSIGNTSSMYNTGFNPLMNIGNQSFNYANNALGGIANLFRGYQPGTSLAQGITGAGKGWGELFKAFTGGSED